MDDSTENRLEGFVSGGVPELADGHDLGSCCFPGGVPELVDGPDLGSGAAMRRGSSPRFPTGPD